VVEVGIDIPEAKMKVIMNVERFEIAQLHHFRGHQFVKNHYLNVIQVIMRVVKISASRGSMEA
jgi:hypothetical protein